MKITSLLPAFLRRSDSPSSSGITPPWYGSGGVSPFYNFGFGSFGGGGDTYTEIDESEALTATAVYACVQVIASAIGTLPIHVRERESNAIIRDHAVARLLRSPNDDMTKSDLVEAWCLNLLTGGNGHLYATRDRNFEPNGLYPVRFQSVQCRRRGGRVRYTVKLKDKVFQAPIGSIVHAKNFSPDGLNGISPLACGGRAIGLALALDNFAVKFFSNGASVGNVIELPPMKPEQLELFKRMWRDEYEGVDNAHKTAAAPGLKVHKGGYSPRESQADEQRLAQLREIARLYQVPPHKIGDLEKTTVGNGEEQARQFAEGTLRRWVTKMEEALEKTLLREDERDAVKIRFNLDASIRGSLKDRIEAMSKATGNSPIMTPNEARDQLDLQPIQGGDKLMTNLNQQAADQRSALLQGVVTRMATAEANAITRAAKKHNDPEEMRSWARDWFAGHELRLRQALDGSGVDGRVVADYCEYRTKQIETDASDAAIQTMTDKTLAVLAHRILDNDADSSNTTQAPHHEQEPNRAA